MPANTKSSKTNKSTTKKMKQSNKSVKSVKPEESINEPVDVDEPEQVETDTQVGQGDPTEPVDTVQTVIKRMQDRNANINALQKENKNDCKLLEKMYLSEIRVLKKSKRQHGGNNSGKKKAPSGFAKPTKLSQNLCNFLNVPEDTLLARTDVTKRITTYIKECELQNPDNRREIFPDKKLSELVNMENEDDGKLTYFNLQRCIKHHFPKKELSDDSITS